MIRRYKKIILFLSIIISFICICQNWNSDSVIIALLPFTYGIVTQLLPNGIKVGSGLVMMAIVLFIRYLVYPCFYVFQDFDFSLSHYLRQAVLLMVFEEVVISLVVYFYFRRRSIKSEQTVIMPMGGILPLIMVLLMVFILVRFPGVLSNRHFILNASNINLEVNSIPGYYSQPFSWGEIILMTFLFNYFSLRYFKSRQTVWFVFAIIVIFSRCLFYSGHSRISLLIPVVSSAVVLWKVYNVKSRAAIIIIITVGLVSIAALSAYKFYGMGMGRGMLGLIGYHEAAETLNEYFGGIKNVLLGLYAYDSNGNNLSVFFNDTFRNMMGISSLFEENPENSVSIFNIAVYSRYSWQGYDQICPTIIEGLLMFGKFFFFIPTIIMTLFCCLLDSSFYSTSSIGKAYLYASCATIIGWAIPGNYMHFCSTMFNTFIPVYILLYINERIRIK